MTTADELERCRRQLRELDEQEMLLASYQRKANNSLKKPTITFSQLFE